MDATPPNNLSGIRSREVLALFGLAKEKSIVAKPHTDSLVEDTVELSPMGMALSRAVGESIQRVDHLFALRAAIKAGTFETRERMEGTVERLLEIL